MAQARLVHKGINPTMNIYTHIYKEDKKEAVIKFIKELNDQSRYIGYFRPLLSGEEKAYTCCNHREYRLFNACSILHWWRIRGSNP